MCSAAALGRVAVSAPSKIILHGEHSVVYGKTAVAASLDMRTKMIIEAKQGDAGIQVDFPDIGVAETWSAEQVAEILAKKPLDLSSHDVDQFFLDQIHDFLRIDETNLKMASLTCFFYLYSLICGSPPPVASSPPLAPPLSLKISVSSAIPIGAGLGSSAALSVCLAAGLLAVKHGAAQNYLQQAANADKGTRVQQEEICAYALLSEKILHGTPSGIDNSVSTYGGVIKFQNGQVTALDAIPRLRIFLVNTHVGRNTKQMVDDVRRRLLAQPRVVRPILDAMDAISLSSIDLLQQLHDRAGDSLDCYRSLEQLIDYNHRLLLTLGVSHASIERVVAAAANVGLHAKLTGAGGGGFVFVLVPPDADEDDVDELKRTLVTDGFTCSETNLSVDGVRIQRLNS